MANALLNKGSLLTVNEVINFFKNCPPLERCIDTPSVDVKGDEVCNDWRGEERI